MSASAENPDDPSGLKPTLVDSEGWCSTTIAEDDHYKFVWVIEKFSHLLERLQMEKTISCFRVNSAFSVRITSKLMEVASLSKRKQR